MKTNLNFLCALSLLLTASTTMAAEIHVDTILIEAQQDEQCSLVEAIQAANTDQAVDSCTPGNDADNIFLPSNSSFQINHVNNQVDGSNGLPSITSDISIMGNNSTLIKCDSFSGAPVPPCAEARIFHIAKSGRLNLNQLNLVGGKAFVSRNPSPYLAESGGAILNAGVLHVDRCLFSDNQAGNGGALANLGEARITHTIFYSNHADKQGGAIQSSATKDVLELFNVYFSANSSGLGGAAIDLFQSTATIIHSTITNNTALDTERAGAALFTHQPHGFGEVHRSSRVSIYNSIIADNIHDCDGGLPARPANAQILENESNNWFGDNSCNGQASGSPQLEPITSFPFQIAGQPIADSGVIDAADPVFCAHPGVNLLDLENNPRPVDGDGDGIAQCDIGALERQLNKPPSGAVFQNTVAIDHQWQSVGSFSGPDTQAIDLLLFGFSPASYHGVQPGVVRIMPGASKLTSVFPSFDLFMRFQEFTYLDQLHLTEQVDLMGFYPGVVMLDDGTMIVAGSFSLSGNRQWQSVNFLQPFQTRPHVFLFAQTSNGGQPPILRVRNISSNAFEAALDEEEKLFGSGHIAERIAYFAIVSPSEKGTIPINGNAVAFELQQIDVNHNWTNVFGKQIKLQEERSKDQELLHLTDERVDIMKLGEQVYAQSVTNNGADPFTLRVR